MAKIVQTGHGPLGIPYRNTLATGDDKRAAYDALEAGGCGAWVGRARCGNPIEDWYEGSVILFFQTYAGMWIKPIGPSENGYVTPLCTSHETDWLRDMSDDLKASQRQECQKFLAGYGYRLE